MIEAAASRFQKVKKEAVLQEVEKLENELKESPEDEKLQKEKERADELVQAIEKRAKSRKASGAKVDSTMATRTEPEAAVLRTKTHQYLPAYIPSVLANEERFIVGQHVGQTNESLSVAIMLQQLTCKENRNGG